MKICHEQTQRPHTPFEAPKDTAMGASTDGVGNLAISDVHYGAGIDISDNYYNPKVAANRTKRCIDEFIRFMKYQTNGGVYSNCVLWLPGDIIEGQRDKLASHHDWQFDGKDPSKNAALYAFLVTSQLKRLIDEGVSEITVLGTPGNHGQKERGPVDLGGTKNYDLDFFWHLKNRCESMPEVTVTFPGCNADTPAGDSVLTMQHKVPFILCHGNEPGFELSKKHKTGARYGKNAVRAAAMDFWDGKVKHIRQWANSRSKQGQSMEHKWDNSILIHGHWHVSCAAPDEHVISCGSLRGIDDYANGLQAVVELEEPSALCWVVRKNGSLSTVQKIEVDPLPANQVEDAPTTPYEQIVFGRSPKVEELRSRAYG